MTIKHILHCNEHHQSSKTNEEVVSLDDEEDDTSERGVTRGTETTRTDASGRREERGFVVRARVRRTRRSR